MAHDSKKEAAQQSSTNSYKSIVNVWTQQALQKPGMTIAISNKNTLNDKAKADVLASREGTALMDSSTMGVLATATVDASKEGRAALVEGQAQREAAMAVRATGKDALAVSQNDALQEGAALNVIADAYDKINVIQLTSQKEAEFQKELESLKQKTQLNEVELRSIIKEVVAVNNTLAALKEQKRSSEAGLSKIQKSPQLRCYYMEARKIRYQFLVANLIMTSELQRSKDMTDIAISAAAQLGKHIPVISAAATAVEQTALFAHGIEKHQAMQHLSAWTTKITMADDLAERFAIQLTLKRENKINNPQDEDNLAQHPARGVVEKITAAGKDIYDGASQLVDAAAQKAREFKEDRQYSQEAKLALADTTLVLKAIMKQDISPAASALSEEEILQQQVQSMLSVFDPHPAAILTQSVSVTSSSTVVSTGTVSSSFFANSESSTTSTASPSTPPQPQAGPSGTPQNVAGSGNKEPEQTLQNCCPVL
jgi:hypothetical protein